MEHQTCNSLGISPVFSSDAPQPLFGVPRARLLSSVVDVFARAAAANEAGALTPGMIGAGTGQCRFRGDKCTLSEGQGGTTWIVDAGVVDDPGALYRPQLERGKSAITAQGC